MKGNIRKIKKTVFIVIFIIFCVAVVSYILNYIQRKREYKIKVKYSFSEVAVTNFDLSIAEKENIKLLLGNRIVENEKFFGFTGNESSNTNLYNSNSVVEIAKLLGDYKYDDLIDRCSFISKINPNSLDFLNLIYYVNICKSLNIDINYSLVNDSLLKFYDKSLNLFFVNDLNDSIHIKIVATAMCKKAMSEELSKKIFTPENGLRNVYNEYAFEANNGVTFYNSGADIIYCYSIFNMVGEIGLEKLQAWFSYWKDNYESYTIDSLLSALQYSEFLNIATVFDAKYSSKKLYDYYVGITTEDIEKPNDLSVTFNVIKNLKTLDNVKANNNIKNEIDKVLKGNNLFDIKMDIRSTAFATILAQKTGVAINKDKLNNYIKSNYKHIDSVNENYDRINNLYYNVILDQLINGYDIKYDKNLFQSQIDKTLDSIKYTTDMGSDIVITRRIVELVMDLNLFNVDVKVNNGQVAKIKDGIKKSLSVDSIVSSSLICDIGIINESLSLNLLKNKRILEISKMLEVDGGNKESLNIDMQPNILTTYKFMTCIGRLGNYENLSKQKEFVDSVMLGKGMYKIDKASDHANDFSAILYGNHIKYFEVGGSKFD